MITDGDFQTVRNTGCSDAQIVEIAEIVQHVRANYFINALQTEIEFPVVAAREAA